MRPVLSSVCVVLVLVLVVNLCSSSSTLVPCLVSKKMPNPLGFVIATHTSYASSKGAHSYCIRRVRVDVAQWKPFDIKTNVISSKPSVCVGLVLVLVRSF